MKYLAYLQNTSISKSTLKYKVQNTFFKKYFEIQLHSKSILKILQ